MTAGVKTFSGGKMVTKNFEPIPKGKYRFKLNTARAEVKQPDSGGPEYIGGLSLECLNLPEGWKGSKAVFLNWTSLQTNGGTDPDTEFVMAPDRLAGLIAALGDDIGALNFNVHEAKVFSKTKKNKDGSTLTEELVTDVLDGPMVLQYLQSQNGREVEALIKVNNEKDQNGNPIKRNAVEKYIFPEQEQG
jgi:hypothetical protein